MQSEAVLLSFRSVDEVNEVLALNERRPRAGEVEGRRVARDERESDE